MNTKQSKKMLPLNVLEILNKYSDEDHRLTQKEIVDLLRTKCNMVVERKAVRSSITDLLEMGVAIQYTEKTRMVKDRKTGVEDEQSVLTDLYMEHDFTNSEICLLIDEILNSGFIPSKQRRELISKIENLASVYFKKGKGAKTTGNEPVINQLFYTLEVVKEAIETGRNVRFFYNRFVNGKNGLVETRQEEYVVTPYDTGVSGDNYYLFCSEDGSSEIKLRLDYISGITIDKTSHFASRNGRSDNISRIVFTTDESMLSEFVEAFGTENIRIEDYGNALRLNVKADEEAALEFALKNSNEVTALEPSGFCRRVGEILRKGWERYGGYMS